MPSVTTDSQVMEPSEPVRPHGRPMSSKFGFRSRTPCDQGCNLRPLEVHYVTFGAKYITTEGEEEKKEKEKDGE